MRKFGDKTGEAFYDAAHTLFVYLPEGCAKGDFTEQKIRKDYAQASKNPHIKTFMKEHPEVLLRPLEDLVNENNTVRKAKEPENRRYRKLDNLLRNIAFNY